jgi:hypothetical protein
VALLPHARVVVSAPSLDPDEPAMVVIEWEAGVTERAVPGSALWRAALERHLAQPGNSGPENRIVREQIQRALARLPSIEAWFDWPRSGWLMPPHQEDEPHPRRRHRPWCLW